MDVFTAKRQIAEFDAEYEDKPTELSDIERLLEAALYMVEAYDRLEEIYEDELDNPTKNEG